MSGLCDWVSEFAVAFIGLAILVIIVGVIFPMFARKPQTDGQARPRVMFLRVDVAPILDALAKVLAALKDLPPWMAIFLAGLALVWTAATAPGLCPP